MSGDATTGPAFSVSLSRAKAAAAGGDACAALSILFTALTAESDFVDQSRAARLLKSIDLAPLRLRRLRIALLAASTLEHFAPVLRLWLARMGFDAEVTVNPFDTATQAILDPASPLRAARPDIVWLFSTHRDIPLEAQPRDAISKVAAQVDQAIAARQTLWTTLLEQVGCTVIDNLVDCPADDPFGNLAGSAVWGRRAMMRRYNAELPVAAPAGVVLFDLDQVARTLGRTRWEDARFWYHSRHAFALDASGPVAHAAARLIAGARGLAKKCLVLDLDNTLWGGVIGDDGVAGIALGHGEEGEAYVALHRYVKTLKERGIILAVCSKNEHETAASVFREHPDCLLRLEDFAVFTANWGNKADNIRDIAATLNIGLDSLVFVDDNPMERDLVRRHLPEVEVIDLPEACAGYVEAIARSGWFEAASFSAEDSARGRYYAENAQRAAVRNAYVDLPSYLRGLEMQGALGGADPFHLPRIAQLINKSNQFHLTGTRYSEAEIKAIASAPDCVVRHLRLSDKFGDNGLIASIVLRHQDRAMLVDTWVMSCRVLGRTVEEFIANDIRTIAQQRGCERVLGRYVRSSKNGLVEGLYERLGFTCVSRSGEMTEWAFDIGADVPAWTTWVQPVPTREGLAA